MNNPQIAQEILVDADKKRHWELEAIEHLFQALRNAEKKHPGWPTDHVHGAGIICEEAGETMKAALDYHNLRSEDFAKIVEEAAHTAAAALRLMIYWYSLGYQRKSAESADKNLPESADKKP
jgi:hypothetical protein